MEYLKGAAGIVRNNAVIAFALALLIVGVLFFSSPVAAFYMKSTDSPTASLNTTSMSLSVTTKIYKDTADEQFVNASNVSAQLLYIDNSSSVDITATNCSLSDLEYYNNSFGYAYMFNGYGYASGSTEYNLQSPDTGYGYGYGTAAHTAFYCTFNFNSTYLINKVAGGIGNIKVNGIVLQNVSGYTTTPGTTFVFADNRVISVSQPSGTATGQDFNVTANYTVNFTKPDGTTPMEVAIPNGTNITVPAGYTAGIISVEVDPPADRSANFDTARTKGPVLKLGPAGTTFSPAIQIKFNMSVVASEAGTTVSALYTLYSTGYFKIRKVTEAGTVTDLATAWEGTSSDGLLVANVSSFSSFGSYDSTPGSSGSTSTSSSTGGGSVGGSRVVPTTSTTQVDVPQNKTETTSSTPQPTPTPSKTTPTPTDTTKPRPAAVPSTTAAVVPSGGTEPVAPTPAQKGFDFLPVIAVIVAIGLIGGAAYFFIKGGKKGLMAV